MRTMNLRSLRVFTGSMESGTLRAAATRMNLSQSAASRLLSLLEAELGVALFLRERRRLVPTAEAEALYPEALRILGQVEALPLVVADAAPALRVICHPRLLEGLVLPAIARFVAAAPAGARPVRLEAAPRRELARRVLAGRHDVAVATLPLPGVPVPDRVLGAAPLGILLPRGHRLCDRPVLGLADLVDEPYVALDETTVIRTVIDAALARSGATLARAHEVSTGSAAYRLVAAGLGFTFADRVALDPRLADDVTLVPWDVEARVEVGTCRLSGVQGEAVYAFEDALAQAFASAGADSSGAGQRDRSRASVNASTTFA